MPVAGLPGSEGVVTALTLAEGLLGVPAGESALRAASCEQNR